MKSHPNFVCWDLHPEKIPAHLKEKILARKAAKATARQNGGGNIIQAAIYNTPADQNQELLIQRAMGQDNQIPMGQIQVINVIAKIEVREEY